jgi:uncharacterized protein YjhX (UPF0386 family)
MVQPMEAATLVRSRICPEVTLTHIDAYLNAERDETSEISVREPGNRDGTAYGGGYISTFKLCPEVLFRHPNPYLTIERDETSEISAREPGNRDGTAYGGGYISTFKTLSCYSLYSSLCLSKYRARRNQ